MPTKILKEIVEFFGKKLDNMSVEIKGAEVVTIKGIQGEQGIQGVPGKDGADGKDSVIPGPKGADGRDGKDGAPGKDGRDGIDGKDGARGKDGLKGKAGKDGSPDTGEEIIKKINNDKSDRLIRKGKVEGMDEIESLARTADANARQVFNVVGSGISWGVPVGAIDDSNTTFVVSTKPIFIIVNGGIYREGKGIYTSYSGGTITLSSPVGTDGFIVSAH